MFSKKNRKSEGAGRVQQVAGGEKTGGPSLLAWPFKRLWWVVEKLVVWPVSGLVSWFGRLIARIAGEIAWFFRRIWWAFEKSILWPIADLFRRNSGRDRRTGSRRTAPLAWVGATALLMVTAGALTAAFLMYREAEAPEGGTLAADAPATEATAPTPPAPVVETPVTENTADLQGAAPSFGSGSGKSAGQKGGTQVKPSKAPKDPALKVAHRFANSFVSYEVGESQPRALEATSTPRLARELAARPPRQPSSGKVPRARVLNVVKGKKEGSRLAVSVALQRSGAATELRLSLVRDNDRGWKVSEVLG